MPNTKKDHRGSIEPRGNGFRLRLCVHGVYHYEHVVTEDIEVAKARANTWYEELKARGDDGLPGPMPFSELLRRFKEARLPDLTAGTQRGYTMSLQGFETYFVTKGADLQAHRIRPGHVEGFLLWRRHHHPDGEKRTRLEDGKRVSAPLSPVSLARERAILHNVFDFGSTLEVVTSNPVPKTKRPEGDEREPYILSTGQYEKLLDECKDRPMLKLFVLVLGETGVRCESEALWLRWEDVDFERGLLTVESVRKGRRTKSGKSRRVPITDRLRGALRDHMAAYRLKTYNGERSTWLFHHEIKKRHAKAGARITSLRRAFASAAKRAGIPTGEHGFRQHDLRHTRCTTWLQDGQPMQLVQRAMGHSTVRVTEGYMHLVDEDLLALVSAPRERAKMAAE